MSFTSSRQFTQEKENVCFHSQTTSTCITKRKDIVVRNLYTMYIIDIKKESVTTFTWGGGCFFVACPAGFSSFCKSFFFLPKKKEGGGRRRAPRVPSLDPSLTLPDIFQRCKFSLTQSEILRPWSNPFFPEFSWTVTAMRNIIVPETKHNSF